MHDGCAIAVRRAFMDQSRLPLTVIRSAALEKWNEIPMSSPATIIARRAGASVLRPRRFWQATVFFFAVMFLASGALSLASGVAPTAMSLAVGTIDLMGLMALIGYAWRRPLAHAGLQILVLLLAAFYFLRVALMAFVVWPNLVPWRGDAIAWQAVAICASLPFLVLIGVGLYRYAIDRTHGREITPQQEKPPMSILSTELEALFAPERVPAQLIDLSAFQTQVGSETYSQALSLCVDDKSGLEHGWSSAPGFLDALYPFASANASGSFYALWQAPDCSGPETWPIVVFGDEGGEWVVARSLADLLAISAVDVEPMVDHEEVLFHRGKHHCPSPDIDQYKAWLARTLGIQPCEDPNALVAEAQARWQQKFDRWKEPFLAHRGQV